MIVLRSSGDDRSSSSSSRGSTRCHRREPWDGGEEEEARRGRRKARRGRKVMQELCIYAGTYTEYYSTYRKMILHSTSKNIIFIMIDLYLYLYLSLYKLKNNACLLQGIAGSGLVHIRSTCLSLLRFPRIFWYNYTHTHTHTEYLVVKIQLNMSIA